MLRRQLFLRHPSKNLPAFRHHHFQLRRYTNTQHDDQKPTQQLNENTPPSLWDKIKFYYHKSKEASSFYMGATKQLIRNTKEMNALLMKQRQGELLTRNELAFLARAKADALRIPVFAAVFLIPGSTLLIPFFVYFFPQLLPSTFLNKAFKVKALNAQIKSRIEIAEHFRQQLLPKLLQKQLLPKNQISRTARNEFLSVMDRISSGERVSAEEFRLKVVPVLLRIRMMLFSFPKLQQMCEFYAIRYRRFLATSTMLRQLLIDKTDQLLLDDHLIADENKAEKYAGLTLEELREVCHARAIPTATPEVEAAEVSANKEELLSALADTWLQHIKDIQHVVALDNEQYSRQHLQSDSTAAGADGTTAGDWPMESNAEFHGFSVAEQKFTLLLAQIVTYYAPYETTTTTKKNE